MPERWRILFFMEDLCFGGTQRQMLELARRLDRARFYPMMLTLTGSTDLDVVAQDACIELHHLGKSRRVPLDFFARLPFALWRLRPDILLPCTALPNIWGRIWGRILRCLQGRGRPRIVGTCRGGGGPLRQHERVLWRLTDAMICNSEALRGVLQGLGVPSERLYSIPNGVDIQWFQPASPPSSRPPLLICVARLVQDKDHITLLRAFAIVLRQHPEARLRIVGEGPEEQRLRQWAAVHAAGSRVEFVSAGVDMRGHYAAARLFVLTSVREGQPNVLLEAMACGMPVVATAVGGVPQLITQGENGFLSPSGDAVALATYCCRLLDDGALCDAMGQAGRQRAVQEFSFAAMVRTHEEVFARVCHHIDRS